MDIDIFEKSILPDLIEKIKLNNDPTIVINTLNILNEILKKQQLDINDLNSEIEKISEDVI